MFSINDTVLYGSTGICTIIDITEMQFRGQTLEYYVLKPLQAGSSTVFVPTTNETLTARMRRMLSAETIQSIIRSLPFEKDIWIADARSRAETYKAIINNGDRTELARVIRTLHVQQQKQVDAGKRLHISDEKILKDAQKLLHEEFALVLNISPDEVAPYITKELALGAGAEA